MIYNMTEFYQKGLIAETKASVVNVTINLSHILRFDTSIKYIHFDVNKIRGLFLSTVLRPREISTDVVSMFRATLI